MAPGAEIALREIMSTLEMLIGYATRAPSAHNAQPWRFVIDGDTRVRVFADRSRRLPVGDSNGRELIVSCGAALENLIVAARAFGFEPAVRAHCDPARPDLLATVTIAPGDWPTDGEGLLFDAIERRHTSREHFSPEALAPWLVHELTMAAEARGARLIPVQGRATRSLVKALVQEGDRRLFANPVWRRELAAWAHAIDVGVRASVSDGLFVDRAPLLAVLATADDDRESWLAAGRALERVLLSAACEGVQAGFLNQPCQLADLRMQLSALVGCGYPQVVLRFGQPACALRARRDDERAALMASRPMPDSEPAAPGIPA